MYAYWWDISVYCQRKNVRRVVSNFGCKFKIIKYTKAEFMQQLTAHFHRYSSWVGGTIFFLGPSLSILVASESLVSPVASSTSGSAFSFGFVFGSSGSISKSWANSKGLATWPKSCTAGISFLTHRSFNVNLGPISCKAAFSGERNAYLMKDRSL